MRASFPRTRAKAPTVPRAVLLVASLLAVGAAAAFAPTASADPPPDPPDLPRCVPVLGRPCWGDDDGHGGGHGGGHNPRK